MENMTTATIHSPVPKTGQKPAAAVLRRCGGLLIDGLKGMSAAWCDPMTCNAYWIGASPAIWGARK